MKVVFSLEGFITGIYKGFMISCVKFSWAPLICLTEDALVWDKTKVWVKKTQTRDRLSFKPYV